MVVEPMVYKDEMLLNVYDFQKRKMCTFIFNLNAHRVDKYGEIGPYMDKLRTKIYNKVKLNYLEESLTAEKVRPWSPKIYFTTTQQEKNLPGGKLNHKLYVLMYDIAVKHLEISKMAEILSYDLKVKENVAMAIRVVQTALMANQKGKAITRHLGYHFSEKDRKDDVPGLVEIKRAAPT